MTAANCPEAFDPTLEFRATPRSGARSFDAMTALLSAHADPLFWIGVVLGIISAIWMLFAAYQCDATLARWMIFFPPIALVFVLKYPRETLRPVLLGLLAILLVSAGIAFATVAAVGGLNTPAPSLDSP